MNVASGVPKQKQKQDGKRPRRAPWRVAGSCAEAPSTVSLAGQDDLADLAVADPRDRLRDDRLVALGRMAAGDRGRRAGARVGWGQRRLGDRGQPPASARQHGLWVGTRLEAGRDRQEASPGAASERELGQHGERRRQRGPDRLGSPIGGEGEARGPNRSGPGGQPRGLRGQAALRGANASGCDVGEAVLPPAHHLQRRAERSDSEAVLRLLPAEPAIARPARAEGDRGGVERWVDLDGDRDEAPRVAPGRAGEQLLERPESGLRVARRPWPH